MPVAEKMIVDKKQVEEIEKNISYERHVERYCMLRQWCRGNVLDFGCGCGYGTYLISKNPYVKSIVGYDVDSEAIKWANNNFSNSNLKYNSELEISDFDIFLALEVIEHIENKNLIPTIVKKVNAKEVMLSYPSKKTTHYNKFHRHDYNSQMIIDLFQGYKLVREINYYEESKILIFVKDWIASP